MCNPSQEKILEITVEYPPLLDERWRSDEMNTVVRDVLSTASELVWKRLAGRMQGAGMTFASEGHVDVLLYSTSKNTRVEDRILGSIANHLKMLLVVNYQLPSAQVSMKLLGQDGEKGCACEHVGHAA